MFFRFWSAVAVFLIFVLLPHVAAMNRWQNDHGQTAFYARATRSEWFYYHADYVFAIVPGILVVLVLLFGFRGKR